MNPEGVSSSSFILHPSSFILHPSSFILHPSQRGPVAFRREWESEGVKAPRPHRETIMPAITSSLSLREWRQVDALCDQFEAEWQQQQRPNIEDYLARIEAPSRPALQTELVRIELEWRIRLGEQPSAHEYARRCPALAGSLPDFLAAAQQAFMARTASMTADPQETIAPAKDHERA